MIHTKLKENQTKVFKEAKKRLSKYNWFKGVCLDNFPEENDCANNFIDCVNSVILETEMYDNPNFFNL